MTKTVGMFNDAKSLSDISALASWDTSSMTDLSSMFHGTAITDVDALETKQHEGKDYVSWDVSGVTNMSSMFRYVRTLTNISALASWNTSSVTNISYMLDRTKITNTDPLETKQHEGRGYVSWDTAGVTNMSNLFYGISSLTDISALASWNTSNVTNISNMFEGTRITNVDPLETKQHEGKNYVSWDVSKVTTFYYLFRYVSSLTDISALASWNTSSVTNLRNMFEGTRITNVDPLETKQHEGKNYVSWDVSKVTNVVEMFKDASSLTDISALASWNTSSVTDMSRMFISSMSLSDISALANWDTSSVTVMSGVFNGANSVTDISALASWNTSSVTNMKSMFAGTRITSVAPLETKQHEGKNYVSWDVSKVTDMSGMFHGASSLSDLSALAFWNTSSVTNMNNMFAYNSALIDVSALSNWSTLNVTDMSCMFYKDTILSDVSALASWNTSSVTGTGMRNMFFDVPATPLPSWYHE